MKTYDISLSINPEMPTWPGDPKVKLQQISSIADGADANVTHMSLCVHTGTHVDAPRHFVDGGETVEQLMINKLIGRAYVQHLPDVDMITRDVLEEAGIPPRTRRVLFKTRNSDHWANGVTEFQTDFAALTADAAAYLVQRGVKLVGVDYLSVAPYHEPVPTHQILLSAGVIILEGLNLSEVSHGRYTLYCLPMKIDGSDGAPARAVLVGV